jgi:hypothetical protein
MFRNVISDIIVKTGIVTVFRAGSGWNILILLESCLQTIMTYTIAVCTVKNY